MTAGLDCTNFDIVNDPRHDLSGTFVFGRLERRVRVGDYAAVFASPVCSLFSKLHNLLGPGGPPLTTVSGSERYGRKDLAQILKTITHTDPGLHPRGKDPPDMHGLEDPHHFRNGGTPRAANLGFALG